jgi:uncharacterized protein DUF4340
MRRHLTPILLVVAALGIGLYAYFVERGSVTDTERAERVDEVFPAYRRDELSRVELARPGETLVLERQLAPDGGDAPWRMTSPRAEDHPDAEAVDQLLRDLEFATWVRKVTGDVPGAAAPRVRGTLVMGRVTYRFTLGDPAPSPTGAGYMSLEGEGAFVVSKDLVRTLIEPADHYRPRNFVPYLSIDLARLEVRDNGKQGFAVRRANAVDFVLEAEGGQADVRASRVELDKVWGAFAMMRAESFLADADADRLTANAAYTITMTPKDSGEPKGELVVGAACPDDPGDVAVVRKAPTRVCVCAPRGILEGLGTSREALADRHLFSSREDEVAELALDSVPAGARLEIARAGKGWHERSPDDRELDADEAEMASGLVRGLVAIEGDDLRASPEPAGSTFTPRFRATVTRAEGEGQEVVELGAVDASGLVEVRRLADGASLRIPPALARKLEPRAAALRAPALWGADVESAPVTGLSTRCGAVAQDLTHGEGGWTMRAPAGYGADASEALDLTEALLHAKAQAWVADSDDGTFGIEKGACRVAVMLAGDGGERTLGLSFGAEGEGGVYARADGAPAVFVVPKNLRELAETIVIDRSALHVDPEELSSFALVRSGHKVVFPATGGHVALGETIENALSELRAVSALHLGKARSDEGLDPPPLELDATLATDAGAVVKRLRFGRTTDGGRVYARVDGVDATFAVEEKLLEAFREYGE